MRNEKKLFEDWLDNVDIEDNDADVVTVDGDEYEPPTADRFRYLIRIDIGGHQECLLRDMTADDFDDYILPMKKRMYHILENTVYVTDHSMIKVSSGQFYNKFNNVDAEIINENHAFLSFAIDVNFRKPLDILKFFNMLYMADLKSGKKGSGWQTMFEIMFPDKNDQKYWDIDNRTVFHSPRENCDYILGKLEPLKMEREGYSYWNDAKKLIFTFMSGVEPYENICEVMNYREKDIKECIDNANNLIVSGRQSRIVKLPKEWASKIHYATIDIDSLIDANVMHKSKFFMYRADTWGKKRTAYVNPNQPGNLPGSEEIIEYLRQNKVQATYFEMRRCRDPRKIYMSIYIGTMLLPPENEHQTNGHIPWRCALMLAQPLSTDFSSQHHAECFAQLICDTFGWPTNEDLIDVIKNEIDRK